MARTAQPATAVHEADVVVVGYGAAGCAAAIAAHDAGAQVVVLEKMPPGREGGSTRVSGGIWFDSTSPERAATYLRSLSGGFVLPDPVVDTWARETHANSEWMRDLGADVAAYGDVGPEYPELEGSDSFAGYRGVDGRLGEGRLFAFLADVLRERGIAVHLETAARELAQHAPARRVTGVHARGPDGGALRFDARRAVVLATGGFEANPRMVRDYLGLADAVVWGSPGSTGDGHKMAQKAGADLWHMDNMMTVPGLRAPGYEAGFYAIFVHALGFIYVGMDGTRLTDELPPAGHGQARFHGSYELFPTRPMHVIFDEATRRAGPISPGSDLLPVGWNLLVEGYEWSADNSAEIGKGWLLRADTVEELAVRLEVDPAVLTETVRRYNAACDAGHDDQFGRAASTLTPLREPPYYAFTWGPMLAWSNGGPRRDEHARVLDPFGAVVPGLYAAGSVSSTYSWAKDAGFHIADALAFGRVAGRHAAGEQT
jgi:succinate dehydrogenase/fumarate reductase flavoprotein subunit